MKELYLAGKIAELLAAFEGMKGVEEVVAGRAKASGELEVKCVRVQYNPKKTDICELLKKYFNEGVNPYIIAEDPLEQAAVIYKAAEDVPQIEYYARFMQNRGAEPGAALGNMILNDTMPEENELRRVQINYGRLQEFLADETRCYFVICGLDNRDCVYKCCLLLKIYPSKDAAHVP